MSSLQEYLHFHKFESIHFLGLKEEFFHLSAKLLLFRCGCASRELLLGGSYEICLEWTGNTRWKIVETYQQSPMSLREAHVPFGIRLSSRVEAKMINQDELLMKCWHYHNNVSYCFIHPNCRTFAEDIEDLPAVTRAPKRQREPAAPDVTPDSGNSKKRKMNTTTSTIESQEQEVTWKVAYGTRPGSGATSVGAQGQVMKLEVAKAMCKKKGWRGFTYCKGKSKVWFKSTIENRKEFMPCVYTAFYEMA